MIGDPRPRAPASSPSSRPQPPGDSDRAGENWTAWRRIITSAHLGTRRYGVRWQRLGGVPAGLFAARDHHGIAIGWLGLNTPHARNLRVNRPSLAKLLDHDPIALNVIQFKLDRGGRLGGLGVGCLDRPEDFAFVTQQDYAPAAAHSLGELGGSVF
jgi:hypothetical protein